MKQSGNLYSGFLHALLVLVLFIFEGRSQIQILSASDSTVVPFCKIQFREFGQHDHSFLIADENGNFTVPDNSDSAEIKITAVGYETLVSSFNLANTRFIFLKSNTFDPVCVTTQYNAVRTSNSVQKITIINSEQIQKSGSVNLADVITYQTGIRLSQDNVLGTSMNIGGISGENVKVLIDGVPVIGRLNGNIDLSQINLGTIERIEIIEGPLSVNYGTNALAGTINLITKKGTGNGVHFELNPFYENIGNYNFNFSSSVNYKKNSITLSGGRNYFDGWKPGEKFIEFPKEKPADTSRFLTWKPKQQYFAEVRYNIVLKGWNINPYIRHFNEKIINRGMPKLPYYETAFDDYYFTQRSDAGIILNKSFRKFRLNSTAGFNHFQRVKNTWFNDLTTLNKVLSETPGAQDTSRFYLINFRTTFNTVTDKKFNYEIGIDLNYESAFGLRIENKEQFMGDYAFFSTAEWQPLNNLIIKPGLRYAYNTIYQSPLIPSIHVRYKKNAWTFRASVSRGYRAPSLKELHFEFIDINHNIVGNTQLLPESSINYHASVNWMKQTEKNTLFKTEFSSYFNDIQNLITLGFTGNSSYTYMNIGEYKTIGNSFAFTFRHKMVSLQINSSYIGRYNSISAEQDVQTFSFSPEAGSQLSFYILREKITINLLYKYNGELQTFFLDEDDNVVISMQDDYSILDMSLQLKLMNKKLCITSGVKNLFNVTSVNISGQTGGVHSTGSTMNTARGISVFLGINYQFDFTIKQ